MSSISIIGTGNMAGALAGRALVGGNAVEIIGRGAAKAKAKAKESSTPTSFLASTSSADRCRTTNR